MAPLTRLHGRHFRHIPVSQGLIKLICILKHCEKWRERERVSDLDNVGNKEDGRQEGGHHSLVYMSDTFDTFQSPKG